MVGFTMEIYYDVRSYKRQIGLHCFERKFALHNIIRCVFVLIYNIMISNHLKKTLEFEWQDMLSLVDILLIFFFKFLNS